MRRGLLLWKTAEFPLRTASIAARRLSFLMRKWLLLWKTAEFPLRPASIAARRLSFLMRRWLLLWKTAEFPLSIYWLPDDYLFGKGGYFYGKLLISPLRPASIAPRRLSFFDAKVATFMENC